MFTSLTTLSSSLISKSFSTSAGSSFWPLVSGVEPPSAHMAELYEEEGRFSQQAELLHQNHLHLQHAQSPVLQCKQFGLLLSLFHSTYNNHIQPVTQCANILLRILTKPNHLLLSHLCNKVPTINQPEHPLSFLRPVSLGGQSSNPGGNKVISSSPHIPWHYSCRVLVLGQPGSQYTLHQELLLFRHHSASTCSTFLYNLLNSTVDKFANGN